MIAKAETQQYHFEVQLNWQQDHKGVITARDVKDSIHVATPAAFAGGVPDMWSPEHLFLSSLSSCFMTTYLAIAEKRRLSITHFECNATGEIHLVEGHLEFKTISLFPKIYVAKEEELSIANEVMLKAYKHCIIANSIKLQLVHQGKVLQEKPSWAN